MTASGGTAPYAYAVKATNNATGNTTILGSSATGSFTPQAAGTYNIDATVTDSAGKVAPAITRTVTVTALQSVNQIPTANAGQDLTVTKPTNSLALMGNGVDPEGKPVTYLWEQLAGPSGAGTVTGLPANTKNAIISDFVVGNYQFELTVTDDQGATASDFVVVTVNAAPAPSGTMFSLSVAGDSLMTRYGMDSEKSSVELTNDILSDLQFGVINNVAVPGQYLSQVPGQLRSTNEGGLLVVPADTRYWIPLIEGGVNDLYAPSLPTLADLQARARAVCQKVYDYGSRKTLIQTIGGFGDAAEAGGARDTLQKQYNAWLRANFMTLPGVVGLVDVGADAYMGPVPLPRAYTTDTTHHTPLGRQRMASVFYAPAFQRAATGETGFIVVGQAIATPSAPVNPMTDDTGNFFNWTDTAGLAVSEYEYTLDKGASYAPVTAKPQFVGDIASAAGDVGVRVKAAIGRSASSTLYNLVPFTKNGQVPKPLQYSKVVVNYNDPALKYGDIYADGAFFAGTRTYALDPVSRLYNRITVRSYRAGGTNGIINIDTVEGAVNNGTELGRFITDPNPAVGPIIETHEYNVPWQLHKNTSFVRTAEAVADKDGTVYAGSSNIIYLVDITYEEIP